MSSGKIELLVSILHPFVYIPCYGLLTCDCFGQWCVKAWKARNVLAQLSISPYTLSFVIERTRFWESKEDGRQIHGPNLVWSQAPLGLAEGSIPLNFLLFLLSIWRFVIQHYSNNSWLIQARWWRFLWTTINRDRIFSLENSRLKRSKSLSHDRKTGFVPHDSKVHVWDQWVDI